VAKILVGTFDANKIPHFILMNLTIRNSGNPSNVLHDLGWYKVYLHNGRHLSSVEGLTKADFETFQFDKHEVA